MLPQSASAWIGLATSAGFQNWDDVFAGFALECPSGARELHDFLHRRSADSKRSTKQNEGEPQPTTNVLPQGYSSSSTKSNTSPAKELKQRVNIGGTSAKEGWCIFNALKLPHVDVVGLSTDLSHWKDSTVDEVYSSHCFEHLGYQKELLTSLREVVRVLVPGGIFKCSVPNLEVLCDLYLKTPAKDPAFSRFAIMRMIYGGQTDDFDFHKVGFDFATLQAFMIEAGFESVVQVPQLDVFQDTSCLAWYGTPISLNVVASKARLQTEPTITPTPTPTPTG